MKPCPVPLVKYITKQVGGAETVRIKSHLLACSLCAEEEAALRKAMNATSAEVLDLGIDVAPIKRILSEPSDPLIADLTKAVLSHDICSATSLINANLDRLHHLDADQKQGGILLGLFTVWIHTRGLAHSGQDTGMSHLDLVRSTLKRFPRAIRSKLPVLDCLHLSLADGILDIYAEKYRHALDHFRRVLGISPEIGEYDLAALTAAFVSHCEERLGAYGSAMEYINQAIYQAETTDRSQLGAYFTVSKAWLLFQSGRPQEAIEAYDYAWKVLCASTDYRSLGNVQSGLARIAARGGKYEKALPRYTEALDFYRECDGKHNNLARTLVYMAFSLRFISQRAAGDAAEKSRLMAFAKLDEAHQIYEDHKDYRGRGSVLLVRALLHLDTDKLVQALKETRAAYRLACESGDVVLMTRSLLIQAMVELGNAGVRVGQRDDGKAFAPKALYPAHQAFQLACKTQSSRLVAKTLTWLAIASFHNEDANFKVIKDICNEARSRLGVENDNYTWKNLLWIENKVKAAPAPVAGDEEISADPYGPGIESLLPLQGGNSREENHENARPCGGKVVPFRTGRRSDHAAAEPQNTSVNDPNGEKTKDDDEQ